MNVTRTPTDLWVAQQLLEATPYGQAPQYLIRDNDRTFGSNVARVASTSGIKYFAPRTELLKQMPFVNAFWGASDENAWITS